MVTFAMIIIALIPIAILLFYIYKKDKLCPEPPLQFVLAFALGILCVPLSQLIAIPSAFIGLYSASTKTIWDCIRMAFFGAAIPEESAKVFILWLFLRRNKFYDEKMDGIVYAVCVSMGFAAVENVLYMLINPFDWLNVGFARSITALPLHFSCAVLMGYYYSRNRFNPSKVLYKVYILIFPILLHGVVDIVYLMVNFTPAIASVWTLVFMCICFVMWRIAKRRIDAHLEDDKNNLENEKFFYTN